MKHIPLNEYTLEELLEVLDDNSLTSHETLTYICSEILRRQYRDKNTNNEKQEKCDKIGLLSRLFECIPEKNKD